MVREWFLRVVYQPVHAVLSAQKRRMLIFLLSFISLFCLSFTLFSLYLARVFYDGSSLRSVQTWLGLGFVGLCMLTICIVGLRGAYLINLELLLGFFWGVMVFIGPLVLGVISCFDVYVFISVIYKHDWDSKSFSGLREIFCDPPETANTLCAAPVSGVLSWCLTNYNSTECESIRNQAFNSAVEWGSRITLIQASVSVVNLFFILLTIFICYRILTSNIITESMNDIINYLLVLPMCACAGMAWYMWDWQQFEGLPYFWAPRTFMSLAICQLIAFPFGVRAGRLKSQLMLKGYMVFVTLIVAGLAIIGSFGIVYGGLIPKTFNPSKSDTSYIACKKQLSQCCCCDYNSTQIAELDDPSNLCPEWSSADVLSLLVLDLKIAGCVGLISIMYLIGALVVALLVHISLKNYKSDYI